MVDPRQTMQRWKESEWWIQGERQWSKDDKWSTNGKEESGKWSEDDKWSTNDKEAGQLSKDDKEAGWAWSEGPSGSRDGQGSYPTS